MARSPVKKFLIAVVGVAAVGAVGLVSFFEACCTRTVDQGDFGPLRVGMSKVETIESLADVGIDYIQPVACNTTLLDNPAIEDLENSFLIEPGLLVWIGEHPFPLRIEFSDDAISRIWPEDILIAPPTAPGNMRAKDRELTELQKSLQVGMSRVSAFNTLSDFQSDFGITIGAFVVGYHRFHVGRKGVGVMSVRGNPEYHQLVLVNDCWRFDGLKEEAWFDNPYYSQVTIRFGKGKLHSISHWFFPFETP